MEKGRPRNFDKDEALEKALAVFWRNGYQGSALSELTEAMGINKPSLYGTFGDKASLYLQALELYGAQQGKKHLRALESQEDPRKAVKAFLTSVVGMQTSPKLPGGCFVVNGTTECGSVGMPEIVDKALSKTVALSVLALEQRFKRDCEAGRLPAETSSALAHYVAALMMGLGVMAKAGTSRKALIEAIDRSLPAIPSSDPATM